MKPFCAILNLAFLTGILLTHARAEPHAAVGRDVALNVPLNPRYPGSAGAQTLTDGVTGSAQFGTGDWLGLEGPDIEATITFARELHVQVLAADFLQITAPAIFMPASVDFAVSENGTNFHTIATLKPKTPEDEKSPTVERVLLEGLDLHVRAVRVRAANRGGVPSWHRAPQALAWIFISEILVNPGEAPETPWSALASYQFGDSRWALRMIESELQERREDDQEQAELCAKLVDVLAAPDATRDARDFCCRQLALYGGGNEVVSLASLLREATVGPMVVKTLVAIGGRGAEDALLSSHETMPDSVLASAVSGLGELQCARAVPVLANLLTQPQPGVVVQSLRALGRIGTAEAAQALLSTLAEEPVAVDKKELMSASLQCAQALAAAGQTDAATTVYRAVAERGDDPHDRVAAWGGMALCGERAALSELAAAFGHDTPSVRRTAASMIRRALERHGARIWAPFVEQWPAEQQAMFLDMLESRTSAADAALVQRFAQSDAAAVRRSALAALGRLGDVSAVPVLCAALSSLDADERAAARHALLRLPADGVDGAIAQFARTADEELRPLLAEVLATRRVDGAAALLCSWAAEPSRETATAAWRGLKQLAQDDQLPQLLGLLEQLSDERVHACALDTITAVAGRMDPAPAAQACAALLAGTQSVATRLGLLGLLGELAQPATLPPLQAALRDADPATRAAALKALAKWPDDTPLSDLLGVSKADADLKNRILACRAAIELIRHGVHSRPRAQTSKALTEAVACAQRPEEQILLLAAAGELGDAGLLPFVNARCGEDATRAAAEQALLQIAQRAWPDQPEQIRSLLAETATRTAVEATREQAQKLLDSMPAAALCRVLGQTAWVDMFNGRDLAGWQVVGGKPDSWRAEDGVLMARKGGGGWLACTRECSDYLIEFEFRLPPGGNSGLFLRPPLEGNPAFQGMEVQILDDEAPQYAKLTPWQYCASVYSIAAPQQRVSKPAGEWQTLRVLCAGRTVIVWLNGICVARANLDDHADKAERIPGLTRAAGHPGLQNEHGPIEFRSIRLKDLGGGARD